jgi:hypothetical protein
MEAMQAGELAIHARGGPGVIELHWRGKSNAREPSAVIDPYLAHVFKSSAADGNAVEMHFEELQYFNSSTIAAVITGIQKARAEGIRLTLIYNASLKWQRLSFEALRIFVKPDGLVQLRPV